MKNFALIVLITAQFAIISKVSSQNVSINTTGNAADASAMLDITSNAKGLLIPRMTQVERAAISGPANSLLVYQTDGSRGFYYYSTFSSSWTLLASSGGSIVSLNGLSDVSQSFAVPGTAGTAPGWISATSVHTLNIPLSSVTGVTAGLLSNTDWNTFNNKASSSNVITSLNGLTATVQTFATGTTGTDFTIASSGSAHTFNLPNASATARGLVTTGAQTIAGSKTFSSAPLFSTLTAGSVPYIGTGGLLAENNAKLFWDAANSRLGIGTNAPVADLTLLQSSGTGNTKGFRLTGNSIGNGNGGTGFTVALGYNVLGNKQLWLGDPDYLGNSAGSFIRYSANGTGLPSLDGIAGDGITRRYVALGVQNDANSGVIFGNDGSATNPGSQVWDNGNMAIGNGYRASVAPAGGLIVQGKVGIGTNAPATALQVSASADPLTLIGVSTGTNTSADSLLTITSGLVRKLPLSTFASSGNAISSLNGLTATVQTFATPGTTGTAPAWVSSGSAHALNIPLASATGVTAGLLSNTDWNTFNNKASTTNSWSTTGNAGTTLGTDFLGTTDLKSLRLRTNNTQVMLLDSAGNVAIGKAPVQSAGVGERTTFFEKFLVDAGSTAGNPSNTVNVISGKGYINSYLQLNIQNKSPGINASSDLVATADNGDETTNYVDLGINSSGNTANYFGGANDAYLYAMGQNMLIGTAVPDKSLVFMTGGIVQSTNERMRIDGTGKVGIGTIAPATALHVSASTDPLTLSGVALGTNTSADSLLTITSGLVRKLPLSTFASSANAISSLNGLTATVQTFVTPGTTGTAPAWVSSGSAHALNIPLASATGVTAGLLSNTDWNTFNNKASTTSSWSTTGNAGNNSGANFLGTISNSSLSIRANSIERIFVDSGTAGSVGIGTRTFDGVNREKLLIDAGITTSVNALVIKGSINNYLQMNIKNLSAGSNASTDIVATADNGTEDINYVDLGINSSGYTGNTLETGVANDGYMISKGNDFYLVNGSPGKSLLFLTGGTGVANERMRILANGRVGMGVQNPTAPFVVKDTMEIRRVGSMSQLLFTNTGGTGDLRIGGDGGDLYWQGGGSRALQMGSYWTTILGGDRQGQGGPYPAFANGTGGTGVLVQSQRDASVPLAVQSFSGSQNANLTEWRNSAGTALSAVTKDGNFGIGLSNPSTKMHIVGANPLTLVGVADGSNTTADSLLTITNGLVRKLPLSTFASSANAISSLNGLTATIQTFATPGTTGTAPAWVSTGSAHALNIPLASATGVTAGLLSNTDYATFNAKQAQLNGTGFVKASGTTISYDNSTYLTGNQSITFTPTGDITGSASGTTSLTPALVIGTNKVTLAQMAQVATGTFLGRSTAGTGNVEAMTTAQAKTLLGSGGTNSGDVTLAGQNYLSLSGQTITANAVDVSGTNVTGTLAAARFPALSGDVTNTAGTLATTIAAGVVTNTKLAAMPANSFKANNTGAAAAATDITGTQATVLLDVFTPALKGLVPPSSGGTANFLRADGTFAVPSAANQWNLTGNTGTTTANFIGTTDLKGFRVRVNAGSGGGIQGLLVDSFGNAAFGNTPIFSTGLAREKLLIDAGTTTSINAISAKGSIDNYFQLNIQNKSATAGASSDIVATSDNGDESSGFVNLGINSSAYNNYTYNLGGFNDAYLYSVATAAAVGGNLTIGTGSSGKIIKFHTGGTVAANERMRIDGNGNVGIGTTNIPNKLSVLGTNPLYLSGVQSGTVSDSLLTISGGVVKMVAPSTLAVANAWSLTGNATTNPSANFLGTTDAQPLLIKINNQQIGRLELNSFAFGAGAGTNTATNSMALGYGSVLGAGVTNAMSIGSGANAGISNTFAIGNSAVSSNGTNSFAIGNGATVASAGSFVIGSGASTAANISDAFAIGSSAIVNGSSSLSIGKSASTGTGATSAVAIGNGVQANATGSVSIGAANTAVGIGSTNSVAIGTGASIGSSLTGSTVIGTNATTTFSNTMILGDINNQSLSVGIGSESFSPSTREKLLVDAGTVPTAGYISVIGAKGNTNNYLQVNLQNRSNGGAASTDVVATNDAGTELNQTGFIDMGINSTGNTSTGVLGGNSTAYLYSTGNDFSIGNLTSTKSLNFFTTDAGGSAERMRILGDGKVGIGTTAPATALHVSAASNPLTLSGLVLGTATTADSVLTISAGTVKKLPVSTFASPTNSWSTTGNAGTSSSANFLGTTDNNSLKFGTNNTQAMLIDVDGNVTIGNGALTAAPNQEKLLVDAGINTQSFNVISGKGTINNYLQLNIQNRSPGLLASSDIVATADNGTESANFIDMGINSSGNTGNYFGSANDAYLYTAGQNLFIGTSTADKDIAFLTAGGTQSNGTTANNERMRIDGTTGYVGVGISAPQSPLHAVTATVSAAAATDVANIETINITASAVARPPQLNLVRQFPAAIFTNVSNNVGPVINFGFKSSGTAGVRGDLAQIVSFTTGATSKIGFLTRSGMTNGNPVTGTLAENMSLVGANLGLNTTAPASTLDVNGSVSFPIITTAASITLNATHHTVIVTSGTITLTLPAATSCAGRVYILVNTGGNSQTVSSYKDLSGNPQTTLVTHTSYTLQSDGTSWWRIQ